MATSTTRLTVGAVLGTVSTAATSITTVLNTATKSIDMLDQYVTAANSKLRMRLIADAEDFASQVTVEKATEITAREMGVLEFCAQSAKHKEVFENNYNRIASLLAAARS